ncbi:hypothetical protein ACTWP5_10740 [Streptomyces sp. 4N509B]|uniref:hypothetical protein n=1 Tax=Streptomyces sp. 4N509B TaxID=3457413 RepID=UPI003FD1CAA6
MRRLRLLAATVAVTAAATGLLAAGATTAAAQARDEPGRVPATDLQITPSASGSFEQYVGERVDVAPGDVGYATVECPYGQVPTGGGAATSAEDIAILDTHPTATGWLASGVNFGDSTQELRAYVICADAT